MLNIVIADDESGIIDLCKVLIEYPNARVVGEAHNGVELLKKIEELHPNTVITDISMPGMTGIELIETVRDQYPDINFVIMSGFTEFEYAQKALQLGVREYLVKPLQADALNRILEKIDTQMEKILEKESENMEVRNRLKASRSALQEKYLSDLWKSGSTLQVPKVDETPILDLDKYRIQMIRYVLDGRFEHNSMDQALLKKQAREIFESICIAGIAHDIEHVVTIDGLQMAEMILFPAQQALNESELQSKTLVKKKSEALRRLNEQNLFVRASASSSELLEGCAENLSKGFAQSETALKWRMEYNDGYVIQWNERDEELFGELRSFDNAPVLAYAVNTRNREEVNRIIDETWEKEHHAGGPAGRRYVLVSQMIHTINQAFMELPGYDEIGSNFHINIREILSGDWTAAALARRFKNRVAAVLDECEEHQSTRENRVISDAKRYIDLHFTEDISLNSVSSHVGLSPAYFSTMFKNETGTGFAKYLQKIRIEEAKKLLRNTTKKINEVAEAVGYHDIKSFNKVFVSETQVKPTAYRKFYQ